MTRLAIPRPIRRAQRSLRDRLPNFRVHRSGVLLFLGVMGPGLIAGLAGNDAGGIATYSVLGAETGLRMLWILPVTTVMLVIVLEMAARMGAVTGQGLGDLIRDEFGIRWTLFAMVVLLIANGANVVAEFAGAAAALEIFGVPRFVTVPIVAAGIWALVVFAGYRVVERVFLSVAIQPPGHASGTSHDPGVGLAAASSRDDAGHASGRRSCVQPPCAVHGRRTTAIHRRAHDFGSWGSPDPGAGQETVRWTLPPRWSRTCAMQRARA